MKQAYSRRKFIKNSFCGGSILLSLGAGAGLLSGGCNRDGGDNQDEDSNRDGGDSPDGDQARKQNTESTGEETKPSGSCEDFSGVSEAELQKRKSLGYVEKSPIADNQCQNCNLWLPPAGDQECGGCTLFKGPVYSEAYCTYWAPQV